ncbi:mas-related G-protein coupled receptor MRG-like [Elephas maximus indicus]|uniref:mas-related G-protein coupled receptor MRG-like n=1 Tax=Elephas maximus indicus TaxID=99487 RepID=UPI002117074B|nr:mas-related G-protein coupled receptor MRG-like [Elephas maximus indicus]
MGGQDQDTRYARTAEAAPTDQLLTTPSWNLDLDNDTETPIDITASDTGSECSLYKKVIFPLMVVVSLHGVVGIGAVFWLLCFLLPSSPYTTYIMNLVTADILNLCRLSLILLEQTLTLYLKVTLHVTMFLDPVSYFSDTVGLCPLAAMSTESALGSLFPTWFLHQRPKHTSAAVCTLTWALALGLHVRKEVCDDFLAQLACEQFFQGFIGFHILVCCMVCVSSLTLSVRGLRYPQHCWISRIYHVAHTVLTTALPWVLPFVVILHLQDQEYLDLTFDLLLLLSSMVSAVPLVVYSLAGHLHKGRHKESLKMVL